MWGKIWLLCEGVPFSVVGVLVKVYLISRVLSGNQKLSESLLYIARALIAMASQCSRPTHPPTQSVSALSFYCFFSSSLFCKDPFNHNTVHSRSPESTYLTISHCPVNIISKHILVEKYCLEY